MSRQMGLVLVDLQEDFLAEPGLQPHRGAVEAGAARLLALARAEGVPVAFIHTTVRRVPDERMPHWKAAGRWSCEAGTPGHAAPEALRPRAGEWVLSKTGFSALGQPESTAFLRAQGWDGAIVAGVHLHACVRQAVLELHERGVPVWVAAEAVASTEPLHAAMTERYLRQRGLRFASTREIAAQWQGEVETASQDQGPMMPAVMEGDREVPGAGPESFTHLSPANGTMRWHSRAASAEQVRAAVEHARPPVENLPLRLGQLHRVADLLAAAEQELAQEIMREIGKPIRFARAEVRRAAALFRAVAQRVAGETLACREPEAWVHRCPLGTIALLTPWNNPLAIAAGQLAPALAYGNAVVWKPAWPGLASAWTLLRLLQQSGMAPGAVQLLGGGETTGWHLLECLGLDGVCGTGSTATGRKLQAVCAARHLPLQAELGGNNAAAVFDDVTDLDSVARELAEAAWGCSGQRCTATRRLVLLRPQREAWLAALQRSGGGWGRPELEATSAGPLLSQAQVDRVGGVVERARQAGHAVWQMAAPADLPPDGAYYPPTIVQCDDPAAEVVQEETFGPVLVVQTADSREHALGLVQGVRQGLAAALYTQDRAWQDRFLAETRAGILKLNQPTVEAGVDVPFAGWKESGLGPAQHGESNREFFTRAQAVYGA